VDTLEQIRRGNLSPLDLPPIQVCFLLLLFVVILLIVLFYDVPCRVLGLAARHLLVQTCCIVVYLEF